VGAGLDGSGEHGGVRQSVEGHQWGDDLLDQ
jgi:hypothetical protein